MQLLRARFLPRLRCGPRPWCTGSLCDDERMSPRVPAVDAASLAAWCTDHLGQCSRGGAVQVRPPVRGDRAAPGRRAGGRGEGTPGLAADSSVCRGPAAHVRAGYPCPAPLAGPAPFGNGVATAEAYVPGGDVLPGAEHAAQLSAEAFARLIRLAPRPAEVSSLDPAPSWAAWNHGEAGLWPRPEGAEVDLNAVDGPEWIDRAAGRARDRLRAGVGRGRGRPLRLAGRQRALEGRRACWSCTTGTARSPTARRSSSASPPPCTRPSARTSWPRSRRPSGSWRRTRDARGRAFSADELERAWAAGVWTRAYDAKDQHVAGHAITSLSEAEARARLRRAGIN